MGRGAWLGVAAAAVLLASGTAHAAPGPIEPTAFDPAIPVEAGELRTAMAPNGYAAAAWLERPPGAGGSVDIMYATRPPGGPWSAPQRLITSQATPSGVDVAVNAGGALALSWMTGEPRIRAVSRAPGGAFSPVFTQLSARDARLGIDAAGNATIVYDVTSSSTVVAREAAAGTSWSSAPEATVRTTCQTHNIEFAEAPTGDAVAGLQCGASVAFARRRAGAWTSSFPFVEGAPGGCPGQGSAFTSPRVDIDEQGRVAAAAVRNEFTLTGSPTDCQQTSAYTIVRAVPDQAGNLVAGSEISTGANEPGIDIATGAGAVTLAWAATGPVNAQASTLDGTPTAQTTLASSTSQPPRVERSGDAKALLTWVRFFRGGDNTLRFELAGAFSPDGVSWGAPTPMAPSVPTSGTKTLTDLDMDAAGNALTGYLHTTGTPLAPKANVVGFDAAAPELAASLPASAVAGTAVPFTATASDVWGPVTVGWAFGDGTTAAGPSVTHAYASPGTFTPSATATDAVGFTASQSGSTVVSAPTTGGGTGTGGGSGTGETGDTTAPVLSRASVSPARWRRGRSLAVFSRRRLAPLGTTIRFQLSEDARVTLRFARARPGRRVGRACLAPTRARRLRRRCTRYVAAGSLTRSRRAGPRRVRFHGRLTPRRRLPLGRYRLRIDARDAAGNRGRSRTVFFRIVAR